ncbi:M20/M25/M40 family metallo-hydrolase [Fluviispira multicolorata]|uniref:M20/M25/M40 family metallo-hydrolase n=1 Tax=Fluviispira multicolorata TaxID=2654512 RepID=A0A833N6C2_9BACT|nr:M20/M25/M40 family metallo-hydrolase [Fluviispira multicolorata]KAB8033235.1 M20/M25/M40 family metallo-hydrolase [Fluviispira multicolorata]
MKSIKHLHSPTCGCKNEKGEPLFLTTPTQVTQKALDYCEKNIEKELNRLKKLVKIPSVSLASFDENEVKHSAEATAEVLRSAGLEKVELLELGKGIHPYVYAEWIHKPDAPTLLLYAHHDVQPPGREDKWKTDPFKPVEKNGRLYGRGTADDKAGIIAHSAAIAAYLKTAGELPVNVKVLIEGEEEIGSNNLAAFVRQHKAKLKADGIIVTDCVNVDSGIPSITTALRGLVAVDIEVDALDHPVHSGLWGGILPDPVFALTKILATLCDEQGNIAIKGLTDNVLQLTEEERKNFAKLKLENIARGATGLLNGLPFTAQEKDFAERLWRQPSLSINAIQSGSKKLVSNIIQDAAWARVSIRIVPNMKPQEVLDILTKHINAVCPQGFRLKVTTESASNWWSIADPKADVYQIAARSLEKGYGHTTQFIGCGASIPFVQPLSDEFGSIPAILVGVEDPYTNAHSENESLLLSDFKKSLFGQIHMLQDLAKFKKV